MPLTFKKKESNPLLVGLGIHVKEYKMDYARFARKLKYAREESDEKFYKLLKKYAMKDFFILIYFVLDIDINHPFLIQRVYDVQEKPDGCLDLWAREHYKSTILTHAMCIWKWIHDPEERICIFSHTRGLAKGHLRRIKQILEMNTLLQNTFPDVFYVKPSSEAFKWSENDGIYIQRKGTYAEASLEGWGLTDGQPTGKHFTHKIYDDIIEVKSISTSNQKEKVLESFRLSDNLGAIGGSDAVVGTRYDFDDPYLDIIKDGEYEVRSFPAEVDDKGNFKRGGTPVMMEGKALDVKYKKQGHFIYYAQMGQYPVTGKDKKFDADWLQYYLKTPSLKYYIVGDPARVKGVKKDFTVFWVIGVDSRRVKFVVDCVRDKLNLNERWVAMRKLVQEWGVLDVGYESNSNSDAEYFRYKMEEEGVFFNIIDINESRNKQERIRDLLDPFMRRRIALPRSLPYRTIEGEITDIMVNFLHEYINFPAIRNDDLLDGLQKIYNYKMPIVYPTTRPEAQEIPEEDPLNRRVRNRPGTGMAGWMQ